MIKDIIFGLMAFPALIGLFTFYHWFRPQHKPADSSNRFNPIRLWWFGLTREELFVDLFPWLKHDELDNVSDDDKGT